LKFLYVSDASQVNYAGACSGMEAAVAITTFECQLNVMLLDTHTV